MASVSKFWPEGLWRMDRGIPYVMLLGPDEIAKLFNPTYYIPDVKL